MKILLLTALLLPSALAITAVEELRLTLNKSIHTFDTNLDPNVQEDFDEIQQISTALNFCDIVGIDFIQSNCKADGLFNPKYDAKLCKELPAMITTGLKARIDSVLSKAFKMDLLLSPASKFALNTLFISDQLLELGFINEATRSIWGSFIGRLAPGASQNILKEKTVVESVVPERAAISLPPRTRESIIRRHEDSDIPVPADSLRQQLASPQKHDIPTINLINRSGDPAAWNSGSSHHELQIII